VVRSKEVRSVKLIKLIMWLVIIFNILTAIQVLGELQSFITKLWLITLLTLAVCETYIEFRERELINRYRELLLESRWKFRSNE